MRHAVRKLRILFVDDEIDVPDDIGTVTLNVKRDLDSVAAFLLKPEARAVDVVVSDVRMRRASHPPGLDWGTEPSAIAGYGPLLALPFLQTGGICAFVPVSTAWSDFQDNGYVLAALALILTKSLGKLHTFEDAHAWIESRLTEGVDVRRDIMRGVREFRARLIELALVGDEASVCGLADAIKAVRDWTPGTPLADANGVPIHVEVMSRRGCDRIEVESLFADELDLCAVTEARRAKLIAAMEAMRAKGWALQFDRESSIYSRAIQLLNEAMPGDGGEPWYRLEHRARLVSTSEDDKYCIMRFAILFAFLRGWYFTGVAPAAYRQTVKRPGARGAERYYGVMDWVYFFTGLDPLTLAVTNVFKRYLAEEPNRVFAASQRPHRRAFTKRLANATGADVFDAYACLANSEEKGDLTAMEKILCRHFLTEDRFFPRSLPVDDRVTWEPHDGFGQPPYPLWLND